MMNDAKASGADAYKDTVFLPRTDFPMRGELPKREPEILKQWQEMDLYAKQRQMSKGRMPWILHWGPPYANGNAHIGHAFTKSLKDVVNRSWQMLGYDAPLIPGWDCHGLPIEWKIEEKYRAEGKDKDSVDPIAFRGECRAFAQKWIDVQMAAFQRLGVHGDWDHPYRTMDIESEADIAAEIHKFVLNGALYRGQKPVMWSVVEKTALAEAEIEYKEHKSITVWAKFPVISSPVAALPGASIVIWTTTPWTLPSNRAIAFGAKMEYALYDITGVAEDSKAKVGEKIVLAKALAETVKAQAKITGWSERGDFKGAALEGTIAAHPLHGKGYDYDVPLHAGDFVTADAGTGFVHIAPAHGVDDYYLYTAHYGVKAVTDNITDDGKYRDHMPLFAGMEILTDKGETGNGNFAVLKELDAAGNLLCKGSIRHDYPHSWRSKAPVIFRTTPQWFIALDDDNKIREKALKAIAETRWVPAQGQNRIRAMIETRPDWCLSRQRIWGVPIAIFVHKETQEILRDPAVLDRIIAAFRKDGADAWWAHDASFFLGENHQAEDYDQVFDTADVWFDSASTHAFVLEARGLPWPADLYLEGSDQHRGWFHSSLLEACGTRGRAPYKAVLTHGFVLDEKGYKMSKSLGNVVDPKEIIDTLGADILRLWALLSDYQEDIRIGKDTIKLTGDLYRRLRNTFRYLLGALDGFTAAEKLRPEEYRDIPELDALVLHWLSELDKKLRFHIEHYEFGKIIHLLHNFCTNDLSAFYFDIRKDRLYCDRPDLFERRAARTVMAHLLEYLTAWLAPYLCFTAEEAWAQRPAGVFENVDSVHLRIFPVVPEGWRNEALAAKWGKIVEVRQIVLGAIEISRNSKQLGSALEACPHIVVSREIYGDALDGADMAEICLTSQAQLSFVENRMPTAVEIKNAAGAKCQRCWKILPEVGSDPDYPDLSRRDADAVRWYLARQKAA